MTMPAEPAAALLIVDVQNDFVSGSLPVPGGAEVAAAITAHLRAHPGRYALVVASQDWHDPVGDNGGHFAAVTAEPDYVVTWPRHCVADQPGSAYHPALDSSLVDVHVRKGQGAPAYSMFEAVDADGRGLAETLRETGVTSVDVAGLATDYCVRATALDARAAGLDVRLLTDLVAGVAPQSSAAALAELSAAGVELADGSVAP
jgi:nicotinamidase/pyrazinamidase